MIKNIFLWILLCLAIAMLIGCDDSINSISEYRLVCDSETNRAYVTYKNWSAYVPNADKFCKDIAPKIKPILMVM